MLRKSQRLLTMSSLSVHVARVANSKPTQPKSLCNPVISAVGKLRSRQAINWEQSNAGTLQSSRSAIKLSTVNIWVMLTNKEKLTQASSHDLRRYRQRRRTQPDGPRSMLETHEILHPPCNPKPQSISPRLLDRTKIQHRF